MIQKTLVASNFSLCKSRVARKSCSLLCFFLQPVASEQSQSLHWEKNDVSRAQKSMKSLKKLQHSFVFLVDSIAKETSHFVEHRNLGMCNIHNLGNMF